MKKYIIGALLVAIMLLGFGCTIQDVEPVDPLPVDDDPVPIDEDPIDTDLEMLCELQGGEWREFPDACADLCGEHEVCAQVLTMSCDCGPERCWDGLACIEE